MTRVVNLDREQYQLFQVLKEWAKKQPADYSHRERLKGFWTRVDYAFNEGPTEEWTDERDKQINRELQDLGLIKYKEGPPPGDTLIISKRKVRLKIPCFKLILFHRDLELFRKILERPKNPPGNAVQNWLERNCYKAEDKQTVEDFEALAIDGFITRPDDAPSYCYLTGIQEKRIRRILIGKAKDAIEIQPDLEPPKPRAKYTTNEERRQARLEQKRDWWERHRAK